MKLEARGITFRYGSGQRPILGAVDLSLESGERLGLCAPSGQGKTTLCKILAGYERPEAGTVFLDGRPLADYRGYCPVQMIWQHPGAAADPRMRVGDVLAEGGMPQARVLTGLRVEQAWLGRFPGELSGGELQRVLIARALGGETAVLLCDEITAMLDLVTQAQIWRFLLEETRERRIGMIVVSHAPELLERVCTRTQAL